MDASNDIYLSLIRFLKNNVVPVTLGVIGSIFLLVGAIQLFGSKQAQITFEKGEVVASQEKEQEQVEEIVVHVGGAIQNPGVYRLKKESRIEQAIESAGGFSENADQEYISKQLNLAQKLSDGAKIYVPEIGEQGSAAAVAGVSSTNLINVNTASFDQLVSLPGIGNVTAQKVIDGRPYGNTQELLERKIVGQSVFEKIKDEITIY